MTAAGIDTWSPSWYVHPEGPAGEWFAEQSHVLSAAGSVRLQEKVAGYTVGLFGSEGLIYAEGHPREDGLCPAGQLPGALVELEEALWAAGVPLPAGERAFNHTGAESEGFAGLRRADATVNLAMPSRGTGLAVLAGILAVARDAPGVAQGVWGAGRAVETVYFRGRSGRRVLGRWYDKGVESGGAPRGLLVRGEDQRRWAKGDRPEVEDLTAWALRGAFQRRFAPLWRAAKGVTVAGPIVVVEKIAEAVEAGEIGRQQGRLLIGDAMLEAAGLAEVCVARSTLRKSKAMRRGLGLVLGDGVLEEVEIDLADVLEAALETDAWERRG